jgi:hypothetical protein
MVYRSLPLLACVASASAFLSGPVAVPGTASFQNAVNARSGLSLRTAKPGRMAALPALKMQTATGVDTAALAKAANEARGLAMDSIAAAASGHLGLPLGCAEIGAVLYSDFMQHNPKDPKWLNRDRFVLSGGHGQYSRVSCVCVLPIVVLAPTLVRSSYSRLFHLLSLTIPFTCRPILVLVGITVLLT